MKWTIGWMNSKIGDEVTGGQIAPVSCASSDSVRKQENLVERSATLLSRWER